MELIFIFIQHLSKDTSRLHQVGEDASRNIHRNALISGGCWTGDVLIADWQDIETTSRQKFMSTNSSPKKLESRCCRKHSHFLAQKAPSDKKVTHNVKPSATRESRAWTREEYPPLWARRGVTPLQCVRDNSLQEEESQTFPEADRDRRGSKRSVWSVSGELIYHHHVMPREHLYVPERVIIPNSVRIH